MRSFASIVAVTLELICTLTIPGVLKVATMVSVNQDGCSSAGNFEAYCVEPGQIHADA